MPPRNRRKGKVGGSPRQPGPGGGGGGVGGAQTHSRRDRNLRETPSPPPNPPAADPIPTIPTSAAGEIDELDGFSFEHLLVGPHALYLHISVFALIVALFLSPKVSPRVWCDDVEMRPAPPVQQFIWHISDMLHAVGFEAVAVAGLVAAMGVVIANFWRDVEATASAPPSFSTEQHDGIPIRDGAIERVDLADSATHSAELEEDEEDPPLLLGITIFIGTVVFMACSSASPLHVSVPPLTVHSIVTAENENLRGAIALLEAIAANVTLELSAES